MGVKRAARRTSDAMPSRFEYIRDPLIRKWFRFRGSGVQEKAATCWDLGEEWSKWRSQMWGVRISRSRRPLGGGLVPDGLATGWAVKEAPSRRGPSLWPKDLAHVDEVIGRDLLGAACGQPPSLPGIAGANLSGRVARNCSPTWAPKAPRSSSSELPESIASGVPFSQVAAPAPERAHTGRAGRWPSPPWAGR